MKKNFPSQRKIYKKLHVQITWPAAYHNIFTHLKDLVQWKGKEQRGFEGQPGAACMDGCFPMQSSGTHPSQKYLFIVKKNLWATKYWILSHFWTRSFCHLELGILLKPVFSNIRFSIFFWNSLQHRAEQSHLSKNRGGTRRLTMRTFKEKAISSKEWSWKKLSHCCLFLGVKLNNLRQGSKKKKIGNSLSEMMHN